jgi:hypothetical protein
LESYADLPENEAADAADAARILQSLLPDGLQFLKLPYQEQWAERDKRLNRIDDEGHAKAIERMYDARFLRALRTAHDEYGGAGRDEEGCDSRAGGRRRRHERARPIAELTCARRERLRRRRGQGHDPNGEGPARSTRGRASSARHRAERHRGSCGAPETPIPQSPGSDDRPPELGPLSRAPGSGVGRTPRRGPATSLRSR